MFFKTKSGEQRSKVVAYKHVFGGEHGKIVLLDLMNKYHILNTHKGDIFAEGQRSVILGILSQCNVNMEEFDKILKGEYNVFTE